MIAAQWNVAGRAGRLQKFHRLPVDAAIIFTDLLIPLEPMGVKLVFAPNEGPVIENPIRCAADVQTLRTIQLRR